MEKEVIFLVSLVALIGIIGFVSIDSNFDNVTGNIAAEQSEQKRVFGYEYVPTYNYGYVEAPSYGQVSIDEYGADTINNIKQVFLPIKKINIQQEDQPIIKDLEDLKQLICPGYNQKTNEDEVKVQNYYEKNGQVTTKPKEEITIKYEYDSEGRLTNEIESMGGKSRKFAADAG